jgi:hypothetical protein
MTGENLSTISSFPSVLSAEASDNVGCILTTRPSAHDYRMIINLEGAL